MTFRNLTLQWSGSRPLRVGTHERSQYRIQWGRWWQDRFDCSTVGRVILCTRLSITNGQDAAGSSEEALGASDGPLNTCNASVV